MDTASPDIPGFAIEARISAGRHGVVWRARRISDGLAVAVKVVQADRVGDAARFQREAAVLTSLSHRHVIHCHDSGRAGDLYWLAMELAAGDLASQVRSGPAGAELVLAVGRDIAAGLTELVRRGRVHRDVSPANILRLADGRWVLGDFGLVAGDTERLTADGQILGTPAYLSPEQARGQQAGPAADVHALGASLFAAATGRAPYSGGAWAVLQQVASGDFPDPREVDAGIHPGLRAIIRAATGGEPDSRYAEARLLGEDCAAVLAGGVPRHAGAVNIRRRGGQQAAGQGPVADPGPPTADRASPLRWAAVAAALFAVALVSGIWLSRRDPGERQAFADAATAATPEAWKAYRDAYPDAPGRATADEAISLLTAADGADTGPRDRLRGERDVLAAEVARLRAEAR